jgi:hypothetical protein
MKVPTSERFRVPAAVHAGIARPTSAVMTVRAQTADRHVVGADRAGA